MDGLGFGPRAAAALDVGSREGPVVGVGHDAAGDPGETLVDHEDCVLFERQSPGAALDVEPTTPNLPGNQGLSTVVGEERTRVLWITRHGR